MCARLRHALRQRRGRPRRQKPPNIEEGEGKAQWARRWARSSQSQSQSQPQQQLQQQQQLRDPVERDWAKRWTADFAAARARFEAIQGQRPEAHRRRYRADPADINPDFSKKALAKHHGLRKHESTALTQIRTGRIGLKAFLHKRRVPGVLSPRCSCGWGNRRPPTCSLRARRQQRHAASSCPTCGRAGTSRR